MISSARGAFPSRSPGTGAKVAHGPASALVLRGPEAESVPALDEPQLVVVDHARVVEHATDQRALAVVDRADGDEAEQRLVLVLLEVGLDVVLHQFFVGSH